MKNSASFAVSEATRPWAALSPASARLENEQEWPNPVAGGLPAIFTTNSGEPGTSSRARACAVFHVGSLIALCLALCLSLVGCGGGYPGVNFSGLTESASAIDAGQTITVVPVGSGPLPINWMVSGTGCSGSGCGTVAGNGNGTETYTAPVMVSAPIQVVITGTVNGTTDAQSTTLTVNPAPALSGALPAGVVGVMYGASLHASGGTGNLKFSLSGEALPAGLTISAATGIISGTPTTAGVANLVVQVTDSSPMPESASLAVTLIISAPGASLQLFGGNPPTGVVGVPYATAITATGGSGTYTYSLSSGSLPGGLTLSSATGAISGTPTTTGTFPFSAQVKDSNNATASVALSITVVAPLSLSSGTLPNGTVGTLYSAIIGASGGTAPYVCTVTSGTLPAGLSLGNACQVTGTPSAAGTANLTVKVTDSSNPVLTTTGPVSLTISPAGLSLSTGTLPAGTVGTPYSSTIGVTGGTSPYSCTITSGMLQAGLSLGAGCVVSGTPSAAGTVTLMVKATDNGSPAQMATGTVTLTINPSALGITVGPLPSGTVGMVYNQTIPVTGGTAPYSCVITAGTLQAGLVLGSDCVVSGTPSAAGTANLMVKATDGGSPAQTATGAVSLTINPSALNVTVGPLPNGTVGTLYNQTIPVTGGTSPYSCTITAGTLPAGLSLGAGCVVSGTPSAAGAVNLTVMATDSSSPAQTASGAVTLTISPAALALTTGPLPNGTVGTPYSSTIGVTGGTSPYSCTITAGTLPAGLSLGANCLVSGTPSASGTANLTVRATDSSTPAGSATGMVSITISPAALSLTGGMLPSGTVGVAYSQTIPVTGGTSPYGCTITSGALQTGLTLGPNCLISGTPSASGTVTLGVTTTDSSSPTGTASGTVTLLVNPAASLVLTAPPNGTAGTPYSGTVTVSGGTAPYSCSLSTGTLQMGLTLNSNCTITGTPTTSGTSMIGVTATDSGSPVKTTTGDVAVTINPGLVVSNPPAATAGAPYAGSIPVTGGTAPYTCSVAAGSSLPAGLSFSTGCTLTGTPTVPGTTSPQIIVTDSANPVDTTTAPVTFTVQPPATLTFTGTLPNAIVNQAYSQPLTATGGVGPYTYAVTSGALPAGLNLNATTGTVSGTPTTVGATSFTITATDSEGTPQTAPLPLTLLVVYAPTPNDTLLQGPYAFLFQGHDTVLVGTLAYQTATVGSFTADGNGVLTAGELDNNHQTSNPTGATVLTNKLLGTYTLGTNNLGTMVISSLNADGTVANNISYSIAVKPAVTPATTTASGSMTEADTGLVTGQRGDGTFLQQTASSFSGGLTGSYAFGMEGDIVCVPACSVNLQGGPVATVGQVATTGGTITGEADTNLASSNYPTASLSGTFGSADAKGRVQLSLTNPNIPSASYPVDYAVYMVNANQAFVMSTDKHSAYILLAGNMSSQTATTFGNTSLSGQFVGYENAATNPGLLGTTLQNVANLSTATIFQGTANGVGSCTTNYVDQGGTAALVNTLSGLGGSVNLLSDLLGTYASTGTSNCTVGTNGRAVLNYPAPSNALTGLLLLLGVNAQAPAPRVAYLTNTNAGYFLETGYAGLGNLERQTGQPFSLATLNGTYTYGTTPAATAATLNASGSFTANGAGTASYVLNEDVAAGGLNVVTLGQTGSGTYVLTDAQNGRYTFNTDVIYAITPTRFVLVDKSATNTSPSVALLQ